MTRAIALTCPLCGGCVSLPADTRQVGCGFCGREFHYCGEDFLPRLVLPPRISGEELHSRFFALLKTPLAPTRLSTSAVVLHKRRLFFPFYVVSGTRGGVLHTVKERVIRETRPVWGAFSDEGNPRTRSGRSLESSKVKVEQIPDARVLLGDFLYVYSAAAADDWEVDCAALQDLAQSHLDDAGPAIFSDLVKSGEVLEATIPAERVLEKGVSSWQHGTSGRTDLLETTIRILYLPLVEILFRFGEQVYRVLFDEIEGVARSGRLPFQRGIAFASGLPIAAGMGLLLGKVARVLVRDPDWFPRTTGEASVAGFWFAIFAILLFAGGLQLIWLILRTPLEVEVMTGGSLRVAAASGSQESPAGSVLGVVTGLVEIFRERRKP